MNLNHQKLNIQRYVYNQVYKKLDRRLTELTGLVVQFVGRNPSFWKWSSHAMSLLAVETPSDMFAKESTNQKLIIQRQTF